MTPPLPKHTHASHEYEPLHTSAAMQAYGKACAAAAIKELSGDACSDLTIAYMSGLHEGRKQEQDRILRIVHEQANAYGKPGECMAIGIRAKVRNHIADSSNMVEKTDWSAA